jgi:hypothetical protein
MKDESVILTDKERYLAELFHVSLRKSLDSTASSICWSSIHLMDGATWCKFIRAIYPTSVKGKKVSISKKVCLEAMDCGEATRNLLRIGLDMLSDDEYKAISTFVESCL